MGTHAENADPDLMLQNAASDQGLHCLLTGISTKIQNLKHLPETPHARNGLIQMIKVDKSMSQKKKKKRKKNRQTSVLDACHLDLFH